MSKARFASREPRFTRAMLVCAAAAFACLVAVGAAEANTPKSRAKPPAPASPTAALGSRASAPVVAVTGAAPGQAGYVHYFLLRFPDDSLEIQVGVELDDQRIAWSFPGLGAVVSPFLGEGVLEVVGRKIEIRHLYGIRPYPTETAMAALRRALPERVRPWIAARAPYCENEEAYSTCLSCLGFVMRALFPSAQDGEPDVPRDFWRAGLPSRYTTHDLLLYLTGMLDLPTREARLRRLEQFALPADLREDLDELVHAMSPAEAPEAAPQPAPRKVGSKPPVKKRL